MRLDGHQGKASLAGDCEGTLTPPLLLLMDAAYEPRRGHVQLHAPLFDTLIPDSRLFLEWSNEAGAGKW